MTTSLSVSEFPQCRTFSNPSQKIPRRVKTIHIEYRFDELYLFPQENLSAKMFNQALKLSQALWSLKVFKNPLIRVGGF